MMSLGKQLEVLNEQGKIAPETFIKKLIAFEEAVSYMRHYQSKSEDPGPRKNEYLIKADYYEKMVDSMLQEMGYKDLLF